MLRNWLLYLGALVAAVTFHAFYFGWFSWFLLVIAVCLPLFSLFVSLPAMIRVRLYLHAPASCVRGTPVYVTLRGSNGFLPIPQCRFRLNVTSVMTGQTVSLHQNIPGRSSWYVPLDTEHCGVLRCSVDKGRVYDYLGLFRLHVRAPKPVEICVLPVPTQPKSLPDLSHFLVHRKRPKPGGGFSEEHELRDYRPGDSMRDIHWKLSVKTDRVIVREAQEPVRGLAILTFDLLGSPAQIDCLLDSLGWLSQWLLEHDVQHQVFWMDPTEQITASVNIKSQQDLDSLTGRLLRTPLAETTPSIAGRRFPSATWRYHILPEQEETP